MRAVILAERIIDGTGRPPLEHGAILVDGDRIRAIARRADVSVPEDAQVIDCGKQTVLPGFVDAHSHASLIPGLGDQGGQQMQSVGRQLTRAIPCLRADLRSGATTMRVLGEEHFLDVDLRTAIAGGQIPGPRLLVATRPITARNGHGAALTFSDGEDEIRKHIRENVANGADLIKMFMTGGVSSTKGTGVQWYSYSRHEVEVAVEEAHRNNRPIAVHAHGGPGARICIEAGVDTIEHGKLLATDDLSEMRRRGIWLVTNNAVTGHPDGIEKGDRRVAGVMTRLAEARQNAPTNFRMVLDSGVKWALGTDAMHGLMWWEIATVVEWGATPNDAILAATRRAAEAVGMAHEVGSLEPGKLADIISVDGDPLTDVACIQRIGLVMQGGRRRDDLSAE